MNSRERHIDYDVNAQRPRAMEERSKQEFRVFVKKSRGTPLREGPGPRRESVTNHPPCQEIPLTYQKTPPTCRKISHPECGAPCRKCRGMTGAPLVDDARYLSLEDIRILGYDVFFDLETHRLRRSQVRNVKLPADLCRR
jgi:hypothetical protein